jgi:hypothetical protein
MFRPLVNRSTEDRILELVKSAVEIETEFMTEALPVNLKGMHWGLGSRKSSMWQTGSW